MPRLKILIVVVFICGFLIIGRLFELQVLRHDFYTTSVENRGEINEIIPVERGRIFIEDGDDTYPLATNINTYNLIAVPARITNPEEWLEKMTPYLNFQNNITGDQVIEEGQKTDEYKAMIERLSREKDFYELLRKELTINEVNVIKKLDLEGIDFETISKRYWPEKNLFSHVVGFVSLSDNKPSGQYGIEEFFNQELEGIPGQMKGEKAPGGYLISSSYQEIKKAEKGEDIVLTLDRSIQFFACQLIQQAVKDYGAERGSIIVEDPESGKILALCNQPDFDPNQYSKFKNLEVFKNSVIDYSFEPGSIFKVITMAAALDAGKVTPDTSYVDTGSLTIDGHIIKNAADRVFGKATMTNVLERSINTGAVFAAKATGKESFRNYVKKFGFGRLTEIELSGEANGNIDNLEQKAEIYLATASFGQGISVTPIQMINAVAAIANQGKLMKPYIVDKIIKNGETIQREPVFVRQVISSSTAATLTSMMVSVLENGWRIGAGVPGYFTAGKTGTAQVAGPSGNYSEKTIHSFIGFAPATNPKFIALIKIDNPATGHFADTTAAPTFGKLSEFILKYYNIPPDRPKTK